MSGSVAPARRAAGRSSLSLRGWVAAGGLLGPLVLFASPAPAGATPYRVPTEQLVVQLSGTAQEDPAALLAGLPGPVPQLLPGRRWATDLPAGEAAYAQSELSSERGVDYVSPVQTVSAAGKVPNDPCYASTCGPTSPVVVENPSAGKGSTIVHPNGQTDLWAVNAAQAWAITTGSRNVLVAVLDSGVDASQPQLAGKVLVGPDVCASDDRRCASPSDNFGHGTHVAGIIAAATNDGVGMASLGWDTEALSIKVLDDQGLGSTVDTATGIYDAVSLGARVINMSFSNWPCSLKPTECGPNPDEQAAVEYALARGVVVVAAAGNYVSDEPVYPASYPGVLSVAASTDQASVDPANGGPYLDFSEYGAAANIAAPGVNVLSTWSDGNYAVDSGTSMAAPHVAAAAALVMAADPSLSGPQVATLLQATASPLATGSYPINGGFLNVGAAVTAAAARRSPGALDGYEVVSGDGKAYSYGSATGQGALAGKPQARAVVGAAEDPNGLGYWLVSATGQVFAFGRARSYGSARKGQLKSPVVAMAASPDGLGYWLVSADGELLAFGNANFYGSPAAFHLNKPIVGMAATPEGGGYWLVARDGGVFAYGDARYRGSIGHTRLNQPIVGLAAGRDGKGYWLVGADGGVFAFGDARFYGSAAAGVLNKPIVGIAASPYGLGYWLAGAGGAVFSFGSAPAESTTSTKAPSAPVVAITS